MLVFTRKYGERIMIGQNVVVTVIKIDGCKVRLAIEAPREVRVDREEVAKIREAQEDWSTDARRGQGGTTPHARARHWPAKRGRDERSGPLL